MTDAVLVTDAYVFFWDGWPSQWAKSPFVVDTVAYNCCEQYMMAEKARVFDDALAELHIMSTPSPATQKSLGRGVRNFDQTTWKSVCRGVVYRGNLAKFEQNPALRDTLLATETRIIAEASPSDRIWGIGLNKNDRRVHQQENWQGHNWLGIALMQVRDEFRRQCGLTAAPFDAELRKQLDARDALHDRKSR